MNEEIKEKGIELIESIVSAHKRGEFFSDSAVVLKDDATGAILPIKCFSKCVYGYGDIHVRVDTAPLKDYHSDQAMDHELEVMSRTDRLFELYKLFLEDPANVGPQEALKSANGALEIFLNQQ